MADSRGASPQPRYIDRKPVNSMHTNTTTLRSFSSLFTALVIALPLTLSLTACDGVDEQDDVDALNEADEARRGRRRATRAAGQPRACHLPATPRGSEPGAVQHNEVPHDDSSS